MYVNLNSAFIQSSVPLKLNSSALVFEKRELLAFDVNEVDIVYHHVENTGFDVVSFFNVSHQLIRVQMRRVNLWTRFIEQGQLDLGVSELAETGGQLDLQVAVVHDQH